jgi:hypothetical protein
VSKAAELIKARKAAGRQYLCVTTGESKALPDWANDMAGALNIRPNSVRQGILRAVNTGEPWNGLEFKLASDLARPAYARTQQTAGETAVARRS